jgi:hypothetical protein
MTTFKQTEFNTIESIGADGSEPIVVTSNEMEIEELSEEDMRPFNDDTKPVSCFGYIDDYRVTINGSSITAPDHTSQSFIIHEESFSTFDDD